MSWCDKLASVPAVGFRLNAHFASSDTLLTAMSKVLDPLFQREKPLFRVTQQQSFDVHIGTDDGFNYTLEPTKVAVAFVHRMRPRPISGGVPVMEMLSNPLPYTQFLPAVARRAIDATVLLGEQSPRTMTRLGIVSTTAVAASDVPPGIRRFIDYMGRPWSGKIEEFNFTITTELAIGPGYRDRCIHTIRAPEDKEELMSLSFDWQRLYVSEQPTKRDTLNKLFEEGQRAALKYFEDLGEGQRFDEKLIREAAGV